MSKASGDKSGCLGVVLRLIGIEASAAGPKSFPHLPFGLDDEPLPFRLRDDFLSAAEISFYHILLSTVGDSISAPLCPKCGIPLVIRSSSRGEFYGCSNYPKCRQTMRLS